MKHLLLIILLANSLVGLNSCKKDSSESRILINFINKTGSEIQSATADNIQIGNIADNEQTGFISFDHFRTDTQMPDCDFIGILQNDTLNSTAKFYFCGTEKSQLKAGQYNIEIKLSTIGSSKYFDLHFR